jgi:hypothetical protein
MNNQIIIKNSSNVIIDNWITSTNGKYCILNNHDYFTINTTNNINCELVMIGGGGAGGYFYGGGGGAGCVYYDNNFILNSENKYKFNIGKGGNSILNNIDDIFKNGLELQGFYNSKPNIDNFNITNDDISSLLNINCKNNVLCPYIKNIVNLNSLSEATNNIIDITKNGYSLLWSGFLSVPVDGNYIFELNTEFLTYIWIDMYMTEYTKDNLFIETGIDGINKSYSKELKAGVFYNFKMFIFNGNNTNSFSFTMKNQKGNINTENNTFKNYIFSLNKDVKEIYENTKSSPTTLLINNKIAINCDGGGMGGYGLNINGNVNGNEDKNDINGGSGGGAGINKIAGISTIIKNENYYGFNGSAGNEINKCGGGGGSYSGGYDSTGGNGIEINWLNDKIAVGGDGCILNKYKIPTKKNNFGSGGDGGGVFDKEFKLCGKSGTNGCVIIYIKNNEKVETTDDIEHFANPVVKKNIFDKYIEQSYIKGNVFSNKFTLQEINDKLLPCNDDILIKLYSDCLCYLHLYSSLFIELEKANKNSNYEITSFKEKIKNLQINFDISSSSTTDVKISKFENNTFTLYYNRLNSKSNIILSEKHTNIVGTDNNAAENLKYKPILSNIFNTFTLNLVEPTLGENLAQYFPINLESLKKFKKMANLNDDIELPNFNGAARYFKFYNVLYEILSTPAENIMGYLLYYKIFYNIIVYNLSIQLKFRYQIVNNNNFASESITNEANDVKNHIINMKNNIKLLNSNTFPDPKDNEYLKDKSVYSSKIELLNNIKEEYNNNQILLNRAIKNYNDYFKNYEKLKSNALYAIIFLVVLIVVSVIIFASNFDSSFKQTYNMVANTFLIITTFLYYNNFKDAVIFENFATNSATNLSCNDTAGDNYINNKTTLFNNYLNEPINLYNIEIKDIFNKLRTNMLTTGSKSYSTDGNKYLYNLYLEKKQKNEVFKTKRVNIINLIEVLKKQISFLFNIILLICFVSIIAFFSLFMFNLVPQMLTLIIIIASIFMLIICSYFIFAIVQPTRLGANKNYWANETPDQSYLAKL